MDTEWLEHGFGRIGARVRILPMDDRTSAWRREALKPSLVQKAQDQKSLSRVERTSRKTAAYLRQGE